MSIRMGNEPQVTVICTAYNHEKYIETALDSFVAQQTSFPFRIYVSDDKSHDRTTGIVRAYAERYPDILVPFIREANIGAGRNWEDMISHTCAPFIAFCDGDDYWTDPLKLQKQYDYMKSHPEMRACFHDVEISIETSDGTWFQSKDFSHTKDGRLRWPSGNVRFFKKKSYRLENFIPFGFVHTSSMFIRWDYGIGFPPWYFGKGLGDFPLWALQVNTGRFGYIDETMSVHRRTDSGSFSFENRYEFWRKSKQGWIELDEGMIDFFTHEKPSRSIVRTLEHRERDDLAKLIKGSIECDSEQDTWNLLNEHRELIERLFRVRIGASYAPSEHRSTIDKLEKSAPLPPYNKMLSTRIRRVIDIIATALQTIRH